MCIGGKFLKTVAPIAALGLGAYLLGPAIAGAGAAGVGESAAATAMAGELAPTVGGSMLGSEILGGTAASLLPEASLATSLAPMGAASAGGIGSMLTGAMNFAKDNSFWLGQASNALGVMQKNNAVKQQQQYIDSALQYNLDRNRQLGAQADAIVNGSLNQFSPGAVLAGLDAATANRVAANESVQLPNQSVMLPTAGSAPKEIKSAMATQINDILQQGRDQAAAQARLGSYGDDALRRNLQLSENGTQLNTISNFMQGNNNVLGTSLALAPTVGAGAATMGDLLQGAGSVANAYSIKNNKTPFSKIG